MSTPFLSVEPVAHILRDRFPTALTRVEATGTHASITVDPQLWPVVATTLRSDAPLAFDWLRCITAVDLLEDGQFALIYELHATRPAAEPGGVAQLAGEIAIQVRLPRGAPTVASVAHLWPAANWHEREAYDLMGIRFEGHPDLRRILCCDDWIGYPLRKDYEFPLEYNGIPAVTELKMSRQRH